MTKTASSNPFQFSLAWLLAYITAMALVCGGMVYGRWAAIQTYGTEAESIHWLQWRFHVATSSEREPVERRIPQSHEPPALVLMRDHFASCLSLAIVLSSVLFGTFMIFVRGALASAPSSPIPDSRTPSPEPQTPAP